MTYFSCGLCCFASDEKELQHGQYEGATKHWHSVWIRYLLQPKTEKTWKLETRNHSLCTNVAFQRCHQRADRMASCGGQILCLHLPGRAFGQDLGGARPMDQGPLKRFICNCIRLYPSCGLSRFMRYKDCAAPLRHPFWCNQDVLTHSLSNTCTVIVILCPWYIAPPKVLETSCLPSDFSQEWTNYLDAALVILGLVDFGFSLQVACWPS